MIVCEWCLTFYVQYYIDVYNSGLAYTSCLDASKELIDSDNGTVIVSDQYSCLYDVTSDDFATDPCCNISLFVRHFLMKFGVCVLHFEYFG